MITVAYFSLTTLSTVGFGDYNPRSNAERLMCVLIFLFGINTFSYIMGVFLDLIDNYQALNMELDDGDRLTKFFGVIKFFNNKQ